MKNGDESGRKQGDFRVAAILFFRFDFSSYRGLGYGEEDIAALIKHVETLAGTEVRDG
ncbi:MAG TPA: hypothetical protein VFJ06_13405 [Halococcus sp.]|nr:hypothetical protein [Halococcus sp.]